MDICRIFFLAVSPIHRREKRKITKIEIAALSIATRYSQILRQLNFDISRNTEYRCSPMFSNSPVGEFHFCSTFNFFQRSSRCFETK